MDCPSARQSFGPGPGGFAGAPGQKCYQCGRFGHIARACHAGAGAGFGFRGARGGFGGPAGFNARPRVNVNADGSPVKC